MSIVTDFLDKQGLVYKPVPGGELIVSPCPKCGKDGKFYVNAEKGLYDCKKCGEKGNLFKLKALYGVVENIGGSMDIIGAEFKPLQNEQLGGYSKALWENEGGLAYLRGRGFTDETIRNFNLGYKADSDGEWIAIPHTNEQKLWNFKFRRFAGGDKTFRRITGQPTVLFNLDNIDFSKGAILVVESETDAMAAWQMGVTNVVGLTGGAATFNPSWLRVFAQFKKVYICLNADEAGQKGARKVAEKVGLKKSWNMILPVNDINEYLTSQAVDGNDFKKELNKATLFEVENIGTAKDVVDKLDDWLGGTDNAITGLQTTHPQFDALTRGLKSQDLIILSGDSGVGKTTLCLNWMNNIMQYGNAVFGILLEGQIPYYFSRMIGAELRIPYDKLRDETDWEAAKAQAAALPFYYYSGPQGGLSMDQIKEIIPVAVNLYDAKVIVIDNLQKLVHGDDKMYYQRLAAAVSALKDLAVDLKVPIILIAHITKINEEKQVITMHDVKGSSTIYQDCDIFTIFQVIKGNYYLSLDKNRMGEGGVHIPMIFDKGLGLITEAGAEPVAADRVGKTPRTTASA